MEKLTKLILDDMQPSLGVTEPGAIAYAVASARDNVTGELKGITVELNSGMYKNAFTCFIPGTDKFGFAWAAALGYIVGNSALKLEALNDVNEESVKEAERLINEKKVSVTMTGIDSEIFIRATVDTELSTCSVTIEHSHTNITSVKVNGSERSINTEAKVEHGTDDTPEIHKYSLNDIFEYVNTVSISEIAFIENAYEMNLQLLEAGLSDSRTVIAHHLYMSNKGHVLSDDILTTAQLLCSGAIEARVLGIGKPAMSITGSGSHGIIAVMPLFAVARCENHPKEKLLRASALSILITQYIKEYSGRLSAMCGCGVAAGTGMACGLTMLRGGGVTEIASTIKNMSLSLTGMICDGGNHGCALKSVTATDIAFRSSELALSGIEIAPEHGIAGYTPEETMKNIGHISSPGMAETERAILDIFQAKCR
ncbi:MAG: L-serine ammonia-lyase, iron-sulfur-dependent, subunit alpha [Eubacteriales bacterium]|nr:L-serine ammonia-lyase, iron-sulfur-dependent, subunit alpha [Eubacteriales bacterium]